jgi:PAS domain S-box-containing protein
MPPIPREFPSLTGFGYDWGKPIGKRRWDVAADFAWEPEKWREHIAALERCEPFRDFVYKVQRIDGSLGFVSASGKPMFDAEGRFSGYRGVASDLTDRRRAEQALQRSESYLAEAQRLSHTGSWGWKVATREITHWSQEILLRSDIQRRADTSEQVVLVERLAQITNNPIPQRALPRAVVGVSRDQNSRDDLSRSQQAVMQFEPCDPRHLHVRDKAGGTGDLAGA